MVLQHRFKRSSQVGSVKLPAGRFSSALPPRKNGIELGKGLQDSRETLTEHLLAPRE